MEIDENTESKNYTENGIKNEDDRDSFEAMLDEIPQESRGEVKKNDRSFDAKVISSSQTDPIVSGNMYEITENNFISGLEHAFTKEELEIWNQKHRNIEAGTGTVSEDEIKYMIYLYDAHEKQVCSYLMDKGDALYDGEQEGLRVHDAALERMLRDIITRGV